MAIRDSSICGYLLNTFEAALGDQQTHYKTRAKMQGFVKKMMELDTIELVSVYSEILEEIGKPSLIFEKKNLLVSS